MRNYKRISNRQSWSESAMQQAVLSVVNGDQGYKKAAEMYDVPQTTLARRVAKYRKNPDIDSACKKTLGAFKTVFTQEEENELVIYVQLKEKMLLGLSSFELRRLAYELAVRNGKQHSFNNELGMAGYDWYKCFMERHAKHLSLCKPEATPASTRHANASTSHLTASTSHANASTSHANDLTRHANALTSHANTLTSHANALTSHANALTSHANALTSHANALISHANASSSHATAFASHFDPSTPSLQAGGFVIPPCHIIPIPKQSIQKRVSRQRGKTSPYKASLLNSRIKNQPEAFKKAKKN